MLLTKEEVPWIEYLEIDEETGERYINPSAPEEIKETYKIYLMVRQHKEEANG